MRLQFAEIVRFACVGVIATLTHFLILTLAVEQLGFEPTVSNGLAFSVALLVTFGGQSMWVFHDRERLSIAMIGKFVVSLIAGLAGNIVTMAIFTKGLNLPYQSGFVAGLIIVPGVNYLLNKYWVFRKKDI